MRIDELNDVAFGRQWFGYFGVPRGIRMLGWCLYWTATGHRNWADVKRTTRRKVASGTWWQAVQYLEGFRDHLRQQGYEFSDELDLVERARRIEVVEEGLSGT